MNRSSDSARSTLTLLLAMGGLIAGLAAAVHCQQAQGVEAATKPQLTEASWVPTGNLSTARWDHTATLLPNGRVLVVGGPFALDTAELYDPTSGTWSAAGHLKAAKSGFTATLLPNGQVLVVGQALNAEESAELYDPSTGTCR